MTIKELREVESDWGLYFLISCVLLINGCNFLVSFISSSLAWITKTIPQLDCMGDTFHKCEHKMWTKITLFLYFESNTPCLLWKLLIQVSCAKWVQKLQLLWTSFCQTDSISSRWTIFSANGLCSIRLIVFPASHLWKWAGFILNFVEI